MHASRQMRAARGMTLIELLVAAGISSIVLVALMGVATSQQSVYAEGRRIRERQSSARFALDVLESTVRRAGYGIDPQLAFDFDFYDCGGTSTPLPYASKACKNLWRDTNSAATSSDRLTPDEIVTYSRNPYYRVAGSGSGLSLAGNAWVIKAFNSGTPSIALMLRPGDTLPKGAILQLMCNGASTYTYVTVSANVTAPSAGGQTTVNLEADAESPFRQVGLISNAMAGSCFTNGNAIAYLVDRAHFFIYSDGQTPVPRTYLVNDTGTDRNMDGTIDEKDLIVVGADVVDMQVAYMMADKYISTHTIAYGDSSGNNVWGDASGGTADTTELSALTANIPNYSTMGKRACSNVTNIALGRTWGSYAEPCVSDKNSDDVYRQLDYPANIRGLRISLVSRTAAPFSGTGKETKFLPPGSGVLLENRGNVDLTSNLAGTGFQPLFSADALPKKLRTQYRYMVVQTSVATPNLTSNGQFMY